jgi:hypothetical protein
LADEVPGTTASGEELEAEVVVVDIEDASTEEARSSRWARRYPPLLSTLVAVLIAMFVLPSSLNLPQTNPTQTLEYAPVPPEDSDEDPPPTGNISRLGLAGSASVEDGGALGGDGAGGGDGGPEPTLPPRLGDGVGETPSEYRCVGNPPRQTEDPLSPPCVAYFDGDNFGATYQGIEADEVRIVLYKDGAIGTVGTSRGQETCPKTTLVDLVNDPPTDDECHEIRMARLWQAYFNSRYQTYDRYVRFFVYFGTANSETSPETRRADAAEVYRRVRPFAVIDFSTFSGGGDSFVDTMAKRNVLNFGSFIGQDNRFFTRYPKLVWGFPPSLEIQSSQFSSVLCKKYVGRKVQHSGQYDGDDRKFGLVYTTDNGFETLRRVKDRVVADFEACGGSFATAPGTFPRAGYAKDTTTSPRYAIETMQRFQSAGVTTIVWPGGHETHFSTAAKQLNYFPEWIVLGDGQTDNEFAQQGYGGSHGNDREVWQYAVVVSYQPQMPDPETDRICFLALREVDPNVPRQDALRTGCDMYDNLRQLFIGIQVAGPRLTPTTIDRGFHAIPAIASPSLQIPACYYEPDDYTCIKDFIIGRWDPNGRVNRQDAGNTRPGCYRVVGSQRIILADVRPGDPMEGYDPARDPCNGFGTSLQQSIGPPNPTRL